MNHHLDPAPGELGRNEPGRNPAEAADFADRIMAAIAREAAPTPTRTFLAAARARSARDAGSALWVAWHLATVRRWRIAPGVRARSFALVLAVAAVLGTATIAGAAVVRVAADPVVNLFQSGIDEQGQVEHSPDVDHGPGQNVDDQGTDEPDGGSTNTEQPGGDRSGVDEPGDDLDTDEPGPNEAGGGDSGEGPSVTEPSDAGDGSDGDQPGVDEPESDQPGGDQAGRADDDNGAGDSSGGTSGS